MLAFDAEVDGCHQDTPLVVPVEFHSDGLLSPVPVGTSGFGVVSDSVVISVGCLLLETFT